ncbi:MAG: diguanylate cyclase [Gammaproteobacteria bacterium]
MLLTYVSRDELQKSIDQLEQALYNHQQWYNALIRTLVCRLPGDAHDLNAEAHKACRFGQWYYGCHIPEKLKEHPGFIAIGEEHLRMHQLCTLLLTENAENTITPIDYDKFANALERMRLEILALKRELDETLYNHDPLTGAITRVSMLPILREHQELLKREGGNCVIAMMDLDHFKEINDHYGHVIGDQVLIAIVDYCLKNMRPYDKVFRYGGEEFLFFMQNTGLLEGVDNLQRLREGISGLKIDVGAPQPIQTTVSLGASLLDADIPIEESIDHADKALYLAKENGRNCVRFWEA